MADGDLDIVYARECGRVHKALDLRVGEILETVKRTERKIDKKGSKTFWSLAVMMMVFFGIMVTITLAIR